MMYVYAVALLIICVTCYVYTIR